MIKSIIVILVLLFYINIIECQTTYPTISSLKVMYDDNLQPYILVIGDNFGDRASNVKQVNFISSPISTIPFRSWSSPNKTALFIPLAFSVQSSILVDSTVTICGGDQDCTSTRDQQTIQFHPPPFCDQISWSSDAGIQTITITGKAFPVAPSRIEFTALNGSNNSSSIVVISPTQATFQIPFTSGINYTITTFTMNGTNVVTQIKRFSFNPPTIQSIECPNGPYCIIKGASFGTTNNSILYITASSSSQQTVISNNQTSITIKPDSLFVKLGPKTVGINFDGNLSPSFPFNMSAIVITSYKVDISNLSNPTLTMNTSDTCDGASIRSSSGVSLSFSTPVNNVITIPHLLASTRNGNFTILCNNLPSPFPVPIKLTPTLNYSTSSNTTGTIITIYGQFITPIDSNNQSLPVSIVTSTNESCINPTYVSDGVTTCIAPPGAGTTTTLSITIDGVESPNIISLDYNKPVISNYSYDNNMIYLIGYNFGGTDQPISIKYNGTLYQAIHTIPHQEAKAQIGQNISDSGELEITVAGQTSDPLEIKLTIDRYSNEKFKIWMLGFIIPLSIIILIGLGFVLEFKRRDYVNWLNEKDSKKQIARKKNSTTQTNNQTGDHT